MDATFYLRRNDLKEYLKYIEVMIYQYPGLRNLDTVLKYFYQINKLDLSDYTSKRVGIIQLHRRKYDDAIKYLAKIYKTNPKDPSVLYNLSLAYLKRKILKLLLQ